ncbi:PatA/PatG family cyanobactin maturation protease [Bradyrhizobium ontarionense]|uniref:PatA/PatG family cyanobactin maturation protease n=1 Tax=Bradyrhizobium ontarionense TaxID=2898149 RepID=A0ABY3RGC3_9BRAD|nr:PatA/PatG family cyanobactin maturation protease [Bradyrhizobium sp. A19]UFZ06358.1 PatA/PatG family cyanobactin maturation protease [Bradyrhizobium sp. A19]
MAGWDAATFLGKVPLYLGRGDPEVMIAVLDGPVDLTHDCFQGTRVRRLETVASAKAADGGATAHGTHVASLIFGQPGSSVEGLAPLCRGLIIPIFGDDSLRCSQLDVARAILLAVENGAHIINISGGQLAHSSEPHPVLAQAIDSCIRQNVLIVAAAGNDGCDCLHIPAAVSSVLAVGAMDEQGQPLPSSNWGSAYREQGILAPGSNIPGAALQGGVARKSGTSFAAPLVSGVAALLLSVQIKSGSQPNPRAVREALLKTATPCIPSGAEECSRVLAGRINIQQAINQIQRGATSMSEAETLSLNEAGLDASGIRCDDGAAIRRQDDFAPAAGIAMSEIAMSDIAPSDCGCGCGGAEKKSSCGCGGTAAQKAPFVYALGKLGYDFGSEARRDSFIQSMPVGANNPQLPEQLLAYLADNIYEAGSVIWTLNVDVTPIYAIQPAGPFAAAGYARMLDLLRGQLNDGVELVSIPAVIGGNIRLQSGQVVPVIIPSMRGMFSWATPALVSHVLGPRPKAAEAQKTFDSLAGGLGNFLNRIYYDLRNLGITGEDRALNYSATNAVQIADVIRVSTQQQLELDDIQVKKSPICRLDSECYDVELSFFNPHNTNTANRVFRFTVDVSDVIPVTVGTVRTWTKRV